MPPRATRRALPTARPMAPKARKRVANAPNKPASGAVLPIVAPPAVDVLPVSETEVDDHHLVLPIRFQCPLCFDVLRSPIQLPCCQRHLCTECFERALELTSVNCCLCRKRIVGFARKKQYTVDASLWQEIKACCPFVSLLNGSSDETLDVEFVDENAPPRGHHSNDHAMNESAATAATAPAPVVPLATATPIQQTQTKLPDPLVEASTTPRKKPKQQQQRRLDAFFGMSSPDEPSSCGVRGTKTAVRPSSASSQRSLRSTVSSNSNSSQLPSRRSRLHRRAELVGKKSKMIKKTMTTRSPIFLRSASRSPKFRHNKPSTMTTTKAVQRTLLQLTLHSPRGDARIMTRQSSSQSSSQSAQPSLSTRTGTRHPRPPPTADDDDNHASRAVTRRPRRPWKCRHCTFENTCFDTQCSMCNQSPVTPPLHL